MAERIIEISKIKVFILFIISLMFVLLGIWLAFYAPIVKVAFLDSNLLRKTSGLLSVAFFGICLILLSKKMFDSKYGVKINNDGIYDNSSSISYGLIRWENIEKIEKMRVFTQKFIRIVFRDSDASNEVDKRFLLDNHKFVSSIQISVNSLKISFEDLYQLLTTELDRRK